MHGQNIVNIESKTDKIRDYLSISDNVTSLESKRQTTLEELNRKYHNEYTALRQKIKEYIDKIVPTVKIVCDLYSSIVRWDGNMLYFHDQAIYKQYTVLNAYSMAMAATSESIRFLTAVLKNQNAEHNLGEFIVRYNTLIRICSSSDSLALNAVKAEMAKFDHEVTA